MHKKTNRTIPPIIGINPRNIKNPFFPTSCNLLKPKGKETTKTKTKKRQSIIIPKTGNNAPAMICVLTERINAYRDKCFAIQDYSAAIENMLLAITDLGYASCWVEGHITDDDRICDKMASILNVPSNYDLVCYLPVGKPIEEVKKVNKKAFEERAWFNSYKK